MLKISSVAELDDAIKGEALYKQGSMSVIGGVGQDLAKAFNAWHRFSRLRYAAGAAGVAAAGSVIFGPVGWVVAAAACVSIFAIRKGREAAEQEWRSVPLSDRAHHLATSGFSITSNDGSTVLVKKS